MRKVDFNVDKFTATFFGIGLCNGKMPGTVGSAAAWAIAVIVYYTMGCTIHWAVITALVLIGAWSSDRYSKKIGAEDPPEVVIDEVAGMWISMYALPVSYGIPAFVLFRIVDILKPFPVCAAEKLPGGIGIMADDVVGGIIVRLIFAAIRTYFLAEMVG